MTMSSPHADFSEAVAQLHAAMAKVANGDVSAIVALHADSDDITSFYGWGGYEKGRAELRRRWTWAGQRFKGGTVRYTPLSSEAGAEIGYTIDIETFDARLNDDAEPSQWSNRVTHIFRRQEGRWRLVHRHASRLNARENDSPGSDATPPPPEGAAEIME